MGILTGAQEAYQTSPYWKLMTASAPAAINLAIWDQLEWRELDQGQAYEEIMWLLLK